jgi:DNA helicase-2/ATP-dependent DNA helicase PcrA
VHYDLLIVDEYQDLNACDLEILRLMAGRGCVILAAGDDEQSIYSFRKAAPEGIRRFPEDYPGCSDYALSFTQRCARRIVEWANHVIGGDPDRPAQRPRLRAAEGAPDGEVALLSFESEAAEASGIATLIHRIVSIEGIPPSDILVLLRTDYQGAFSVPIRERLEQLGIPCADPEGVNRILGQPDNRCILATLRLLVNPADSLAWASLLELTPGIGRQFVEHIYDRARRHGSQFGAALRNAYEERFTGAPASSGKRATELVHAVLAWLDGRALPDEEPGGGWGRWILATAGGEVVPAATDDLRELLDGLQNLVEPGQPFGRYLGLIGPLGRDRALAQSSGVRIMSMQAAKGLTVQATIIAAVEEGIIPRPDADLAEERRLLYVAMTRARRYLFCTWARRRRGPTARAGRPRVWLRRPFSSLLRGGSVPSEEGETYIVRRWP